MTKSKRALFVAALTTTLLLVAAPAFAHVTVRADNPAPEAFAKYTVRVPNESEDAATTKVELQLPEGFSAGGYQPVAGWKISVEENVITIDGGSIEPGQFQEFSFSAQNPAETGDLTFPAIQTYDDGEKVRWVGEPDSDSPAPVVTIEGEAGGHGHDDEAATDAATETTATEASDDSSETATSSDADAEPASSSSNTLSVVALIAGLLGLILGALAFARSGRATER